MPVNIENMLKLVASGGYGHVENQWTAAIEDPGTDLPELVPVLEALAKAEQTESAELLAWSTIAPARDRMSDADCLQLLRRMFLAVPDSQDLRSELMGQYEIVYADSPHVEKLVRSSGLADGSKMPRLALRTLELCLAAEPGSYLFNRQDDSVAQVLSVNDDCTAYAVRVGRGERVFESHELAREFGHADPDDFRVLTQADPERLKQLLDKEPAKVIVSVLKAQRGHFNADDLKYTLVPRYIPADQWSKWWTRARAALKKNHKVRVEGRSPVTLVYDPTGWTIEDVSWEEFPNSEHAGDYLNAVERYFREAKARNLPVKSDHLARMVKAIAAQLQRVRAHLPDGGLGLALVIEDVLARDAALSVADAIPSEQIIREAQSPNVMLRQLSDHRLYPAALLAAKQGCPDTWPELFAKVLPRAPISACEPLAHHLHEANRTDLLNGALVSMMDDPAQCVESLAWLWKGSKALEGASMPRPIEVLTRLLSALGEWVRDDHVGRERLASMKNAVKSGLGASQAKAFKQCLDGMEEGMAAAIRNQVSRHDGLSPTQRGFLVEEIRKRFPNLWAKKKIDAWRDDTLIYCTESGLAKLEKDINHLVNVEMPANAKAIGEAASHGDLSENSEYKFALEARDMLRARLASVQRQLSMARIIEPDDIPTAHVGVGSKIALRRRQDGREYSMVFLGPWEASIDNGIFNYQAPISQELMGHAVGDVLELELHDERAAWSVERIERGL